MKKHHGEAIKRYGDELTFDIVSEMTNPGRGGSHRFPANGIPVLCNLKFFNQLS